MEMWAFGILCGTIFAIIVFLACLTGRMNEYEHNQRQLLDCIVCNRNGGNDHTVRDCCSDLLVERSEEEQKGPSPEEITSVLYVLRMGSSHYEREILDYLIDKIDERRAKDE